MEQILIQLGNWGKEYRGDFIAGAIAFIIPLLITTAINGFFDLVSITSFFGLTFTVFVLFISNRRTMNFLKNQWRRKKFLGPVTVGILNGYLSPEKKGNVPNSPYSDFKPKDWFDALSKHNEFKVNWISASEISLKFDIILNPFGEEYPEINKPNLITLRKIVKYIKEGGIFVNVAGLAFYYLWDGTDEDLSGPLFETYQINRKNLILERKVFLRASHLLDSSLYKYFGIRTTMFGSTILPVKAVDDEFFKKLVPSGKKTTLNEFRSAFRSEREDSFLIPIVQAEHTTVASDGKQMIFPCYPISATEYGKGYLIINGLCLINSRQQDFDKVVETLKCITNKLKQIGNLC